MGVYTKSMPPIVIYLRWHFGTGLRELYEFWENLAWFGYHFFSIPLLAKTLIRPIYRIHETAPPTAGLNIELFFENLTVNLIARIVGFFLRVFLIAVGILYEFAILIIGPAFLAVWLLLPVLAVVFMFMGMRMVL